MTQEVKNCIGNNGTKLRNAHHMDNIFRRTNYCYTVILSHVSDSLKGTGTQKWWPCFKRLGMTNVTVPYRILDATSFKVFQMLKNLI